MSILNITKELCAEKGISVSRMEKEIGLGSATASRWAKSSPTANVVRKVAKYFNVSTDYLLGETEIREREESVRDVLSEKGGLYFKFAKQAKDLDISEEDLQFIFNIYENIRRYRKLT